jgi:hypothetical protein
MTLSHDIFSTLRTVIVNRFLNDREKTCCVTTCNWDFDSWCNWMKLKLISRIIATRRFRFFLIFCFNCINLWIVICFSNRNFSTNLATLFWSVLSISKLFEMLFVVLLMRIRIFSFVIVFFFCILIKSFHFSLFWSLSIVVLTTTRSFLLVFTIDFFIESFNLFLC